MSKKYKKPGVRAMCGIITKAGISAEPPAAENMIEPAVEPEKPVLTFADFEREARLLLKEDDCYSFSALILREDIDARDGLTDHWRGCWYMLCDGASLDAAVKLCAEYTQILSRPVYIRIKDKAVLDNCALGRDALIAFGNQNHIEIICNESADAFVNFSDGCSYIQRFDDYPGSADDAANYSARSFTKI